MEGTLRRKPSTPSTSSSFDGNIDMRKSGKKADGGDVEMGNVVEVQMEMKRTKGERVEEWVGRGLEWVRGMGSRLRDQVDFHLQSLHAAISELGWMGSMYV